MKKTLILLLLLGSLAGFSQKVENRDTINPSNKAEREYYLKKSHNKSTTAQVLLVGGTALIVGGVFIAKPKGDNFMADLLSLLLGGVIISAGIIADIVSIPFFISASKYKRKAAAVSVLPSVMPVGKAGLGLGFVPSVAVSISF